VCVLKLKAYRMNGVRRAGRGGMGGPKTRRSCLSRGRTRVSCWRRREGGYGGEGELDALTWLQRGEGDLRGDEVESKPRRGEAELFPAESQLAALAAPKLQPAPTPPCSPSVSLAAEPLPQINM